MARLNPNYNKTITIYNCLKGPDNPATPRVDVWYKRVLADCFFTAAMQQVNSGINSQMSGAFTARIPASPLYKPYSEWKALAANVRGNYYTIHNDDVVILGSSTEIISNVVGNTAAEVLARNKPDAFKITATSDNSSGAEPHYRLGG